MEVADLEAKLGSSDHYNKRSDPEKTPGEVDDSGDAKRPREGDHDHNGAMKMEMDEEEEEEEDMTPYQPFGFYCKNWIMMCGHKAKFDDPTELPPMRRTDGPMLPMRAIHVDTMEIYYVKVAQITGKLQWPLDVYGDVAVRDNLDYKRNYLFRRSRERCQILTSPQVAIVSEITVPPHSIRFGRTVSDGGSVGSGDDVLPTQTSDKVNIDAKNALLLSHPFSLSTRLRRARQRARAGWRLPRRLRRCERWALAGGGRVGARSSSHGWRAGARHRTEEAGVVRVKAGDGVYQRDGFRVRIALELDEGSTDSLLELAGPSRAVLLLDPADFEIFLKVKAKEESEEDTVLCCRVFGCNSIASKEVQSYAKTKVVSSEHSTIEVKYGHLMCSLEATITFWITSGSGNFCACFTARTASIGEDVVLLDTRGREVSVTKDGEVVLQRRVVVVEEQGNLILGIKAAQLDDKFESSALIEMKMDFCARSALRSECCFEVGSTRVQTVVAWSLLP
ncbi:hypothetical protein PR202_gb00350 [Eleusine coracana subsp. coracana]|uniref:DUF6598 domain-containing protein n=1 Tax=Eleusine coracana subsp. coracana TaxID=191504 RepID=A0AAV5DT54_ELECO|nr:hypothetical protein PR202_gb00350 [Eleusine coracana subsp. coracana]